MNHILLLSRKLEFSVVMIYCLQVNYVKMIHGVIFFNIHLTCNKDMRVILFYMWLFVNLSYTVCLFNKQDKI